MTPDDVEDYRFRVQQAKDKLLFLAKRALDNHDEREYIRLMGKAAGLELALDYLRAHAKDTI